jgi:hypothetical protein
MPKKKTPGKKPIHHFLWSTFFIFATFAVYIYAEFFNQTFGTSSMWPLGAIVFSFISLVLVLHEKHTKQLGKGRFLWSIFFTTLTLAFSIYLAVSFPIFITVIPLITTFVALFLLVHEKYYY